MPPGRPHRLRDSVDQPIPYMKRLTALVVLGASAASGGCDDPNAPQVAARTESPISRGHSIDYPEGTAFAIGGIPIPKSAVDAYVPLMKLIDPHLAEPALRRAAFANITLPIHAARALDPDSWEAAFQKAQGIHAQVRETGELPADAPTPNYLNGSWLDIGMVPFQAAIGMEPGSYSRLVESPSAWTFFKLIATNLDEGEAYDGLTQVSIVRYDVPFLPQEGSQALVQQAIDTLPFEIVDEEWEHIVPPIVLYKSGQ